MVDKRLNLWNHIYELKAKTNNMYNTLHAATGALVAMTIFPSNWPAAFLLGWASHFVLDAIPHGDDASDELLADWKLFVRRSAIGGGIDLTILTLLVVWWVMTHGFYWVFLAAVIGSALPDLMWGFTVVIGKPGLFGFLGRFHVTVHNALKIKLPFWFGLSYQIFSAGILWWVLIK